MNELIIAIGLLFVIEGLFYSVMPGSMKNMARELLNIPEQTLRVVGLAAMLIGVFIVWLIKGS